MLNPSKNKNSTDKGGKNADKKSTLQEIPFKLFEFIDK